MREAVAGVIGDAGAAGVEVFVFMSVLSEKYVPKAARRYRPSCTDFDHDTAPNDFLDFLTAAIRHLKLKQLAKLRVRSSQKGGLR